MTKSVAKIETVQAPALVSESSAILSMIERLARDPNVDIDKMERILLMQERMVARQSKTNFDAALAEMQQELPVIEKKGKIEIREKDSAGKRTGDIQQSTAYAKWEDINDAIKPVLAKHGFALSFRTGLSEDGRVKVTGILSHRDGHREETTIVLQHDSTGSKNSVQAVGSSLSYGKRYTATALLNVTARGEDDDGEAAGQPELLSDEQVREVFDLLTTTGANVAVFLKRMKIDGITELRADQFDYVIKLINDNSEMRKALKAKEFEKAREVTR